MKLGKILTMLCLVLALCLLLLPTQAEAAVVDSGTCGDNLTWTLDDTGTLTISGTGPMTDYGGDETPWYRNTLVKTVVIEDGVTTIGFEAFNECTNLRTVTISDSVTAIANSAFSGCTSLKYNISDNGKYLGSAENPYFALIASRTTNITTCQIHSDTRLIGGGAFDGCRRLTKITIPDGIITIGDYSFYDCASLTSVTIGDSVITIGRGAFYACYDLTEITIPDSVTVIGDYAFSLCDSLTYNIYDTGKYLGNAENPYFALIGRTTGNITTCQVHKDTKLIGGGAFNNCQNLTQVTIGDSVTTIGYGAFHACNALTSVTIGVSVTTIGDSAFYGCHNLTSIIIPDSVTLIGDSAFEYCDRLTSVAIPDSVTTIGKEAFSSCTRLTTVTIGDGVTTIGAFAFSSCKKLTEINIPDSVATIMNAAFSGCTSLKYNIFDNGKYLGNAEKPYFALIDTTASNITTCQIYKDTRLIGDYAFSFCTGLSSIIIPDSVTTIGQHAFYSCDRLATIIYCGTEDQWDAIAIGGNNQELTEATRKYHDWRLFVCNKPATCAVCGITGNEILGHSFTTYVDDGNATCITDGTMTAKCDRCEETDTLPDADSKLGHSFTNYASDGNATCLEDGTKTAKCDRCDATDTVIEEGTVLGHNFAEYVSDGNATCLDDGTKTAKCDRCNVTDTLLDEGSALGHSFTNYVSDGNATCLTDGTKTANCSRCEETDTLPDADSKLGHSFTNYVSDGNATCLEDGTKTAKCDRCEETDTQTDTGSSEGHTVLNGTCSVCGYVEYIFGDIDGSKRISTDDVVSLLLYISMPDMFPLTDGVNVDFNNDGAVTTDDAVKLLLHISMPDMFPLEGEITEPEDTEPSLPTEPTTPSEPTEPEAEVLIISDTQTISNRTIDSDVYITSTGRVTFYNVTVNGDIYCYGQLVMSGCVVNDIYAYAYGSMFTCSAFDGVHGKVSGGVSCNKLTVLDNALDYAFQKWGKK